MPQIPQYTPEVEASSRGLPEPHASPTGIGTAIAGFGKALGDVGDALYEYQEQNEVADVQTQMAQARATWTVELEKRANSPHANDPDFADTFSQDFSNSISKIGDNVSTRAGRLAFQQQTAELTSHFAQTAGMFQVAAAGVKAKQDYLTLLDANRNTVLTDPFQFDSVLRSTEAALSDPKGPYANMPADARDLLTRKTRADLALSAAEGAIRMNPRKALADIQGGKWGAYLDADRTNALMGAATSAVTAQEVDAARRERLAEKARNDASDATLNDFIKQAVKDPSSVTADSIASSNMKPETKIAMIGKVNEGFFDKPQPTNPQLFLSLFDRIHLPDGNPNKITDQDALNQFVGKGLSLPDLHTLRSEVSQKDTVAGQVEQKLFDGMLNTVKASLTKATPDKPWVDPAGQTNFQHFLSWVLPEYRRQRAAGKTPQELLDPNSKEYLGKPASQLVRQPAQIVSDLMRANPDLTGHTSPLSDRATRRAHDKNGAAVFEVGGKWVYGDGKPYQP